MLLKLILFFLTINLQIFGGEIVLKSEKVFNCDIIAEDEEFVRVKFKGDVYKIPKEEILFLNKDVEPKFESYNITKILLPDGNVVQGRIIAEDTTSITLENSEESVAVPKTSITKIQRGTEEFAIIPEKYLIEKKTDKELKNEYGFYFSIYKNQKQFFVNEFLEGSNVIHKNSFILGGYIETEKLKFKFVQTGFDFFIHSGTDFNKSITLFGLNYYLNLKKEIFNSHLIYFQLGPSLGFINLISNYQNHKNNGSIGYSIEAGYQKVFSEEYHLKIGFNYFRFDNTNNEMISYGPRISFGKRF